MKNQINSEKKMKNLLFKLMILLSAITGVISCSHKEVFFKYHSISNSEWNRNEQAVFQVNIEDSSQPYNLSLELRNNNSYPFSNIWLFVDYKMPDGTSRKDTVSAELADVYGKWHGKGLSLHNISIPYKTSFLYPDTGTYIYTVSQGMREDILKGISDIGLKVSKESVE